MEEVQRGVNISYSSQPVYRKYAAENIQLQRHCAQSRIQHKAEEVSQSLKCSCREEYSYGGSATWSEYFLVQPASVQKICSRRQLSSQAADSSVQLFLCFLKDIRQMIKRLVTDLFKCNVHQNNFGQVHCDKAEY